MGISTSLGTAKGTIRRCLQVGTTLVTGGLAALRKAAVHQNISFCTVAELARAVMLWTGAFWQLPSWLWRGEIWWP